MTKLFINDIEYPLDDGIIINDKKTEELDSAIITIGFVPQLNLSPFDKAKIEGDTIGEKHYVINTWNNTTVSFNPLKYSYTISLISEAIKLQKIVCPNLAITQPIGISKKTIYDKIKEYYDAFIKPQYPELVLSQDLINLTSEVIAPEYLFSRPTIYEVFNQMLIKIGCCVNVVNNEITYKRLDDYGQEIDNSKLHYVNDTQSINEYANRLDIEVENAISKDVNYSTTSGITLRAENQPVLNDDNMQIILDKPIYDMEDKSVFIYFPIIDIDEFGKVDATKYKRKYDITNHIVEKSIYDTYLVSNSPGLISEKGYKRNALYYVAGDNKIQGLTYSENAFLGIDSPIALYNILRQQVEDGYTPAFSEGSIRDNVFFKVEYKTSDRFRLSVEKENDYNATLIDSQSETQIEAETFGKVEQDKINRLGNKEIIITATYKKGERIPELGDYIDEYILAQREIVYYDEFTIFKGYLYKHFVRKNMFYGLNSKKRFTQISDEYVTRNEIINYDLKFSSEKPTDEYKYLARFILQPLCNYSYTGEIYPEYAKYLLFKFKNKTDEDIVYDGYILKTASSYSCGKSNVVSVQMDDNYSAGIQVTQKATGGNLQKYVKYVDNYGEFKTFEVELRSNREEDFLESGTGGAIDFDNHKPIADAFPYVSEYNSGSLYSNYLVSTNKTIYKDNREVFALNMNFNFKDTPEVIIGDISRFTGFVIDQAKDLRFCYSHTEKYEIGDNKGLGQETTGSVNITNAQQWYDNNINSMSITFNLETGVSYGVLDKDGNLILGVNGINGKSPAKTLYLHISKKAY